MKNVSVEFKKNGAVVSDFITEFAKFLRHQSHKIDEISLGDGSSTASVSSSSVSSTSCHGCHSGQSIKSAKVSVPTPIVNDDCHRGHRGHC